MEKLIIDSEAISISHPKDLEITMIRDHAKDLKMSGNKLWKLKYNLLKAKREDFSTILTFGGAFSNHIAAVAEAGVLFNFKTIGVIRGEIIEPLNPTLAFAKAQGMDFFAIGRQEYRKKGDPVFMKMLQNRFNSPYIVPEGGSNALALKGCSELIQSIQQDYDYICVACGTGGTMAGLILGAAGQGRVLGFPALKGGAFLYEDIKKLLMEADANVNDEHWELITDYHFGGYAKFKPALIDFINTFKRKHGVQLDPIYTGKMVYGVMDLIEKDYFPVGSCILMIHTGGLQGIEGFNQRFGNLLV